MRNRKTFTKLKMLNCIVGNGQLDAVVLRRFKGSYWKMSNYMKRLEEKGYFNFDGKSIIVNELARKFIRKNRNPFSKKYLIRA